MANEIQKQLAARAALQYVKPDTVVGVGTGSTVNYFIEELAAIKHNIEGAVASSVATAEKLKAKSIPVIDLNSLSEIPVYIDGADEANEHLQLIKGGGGALTREKIVAAVAKSFVCMIDKSKFVSLLGTYPLAIEVIPMARGYVARQLVRLGGTPVYRENYVTDNGNIILDVYNLSFSNPIELEKNLNNITGVVCTGLFAQRTADILLIGTADDVKILTKT